MLNRRTFLSVIGLAGSGALFDRQRVASRRSVANAMPGAAHLRGSVPIVHPTPRQGISGARVATAAQLGKSAHLAPLFDGIRAIPEIADGIRCSCGCAELPGYYSLLSCFEGDAMAKICPICQGAGKLTVRMYGEGRTLAEIRVAVDAQFG